MTHIKSKPAIFEQKQVSLFERLMHTALFFKEGGDR